MHEKGVFIWHFSTVAAGCYTSRIRIKQEVRLCEAMLRSAERLSVAASLEGEKDPVKAMEYWWKKLHFLQFHDSVPGNTPAAFEAARAPCLYSIPARSPTLCSSAATSAT